ncbi:serine hydrolase domain-containing protein [Phreatobacter sp.]|uniref:serine hydrolase domain-containing protein n=1 Tax=Phreatobacter sp. TaxID=1966341 RepID=UPI003F724307
MSSKEEVLAAAVARQDVPFVVAMTANAAGVTWSGAAGNAAAGRKAMEDTVFRIFSMTKAIGSTAAMILIDRGRLDLDTPVEDILPDFASIQVLDRFDGETPVMRAPKRKATIRHLATHTSGLEYEFWNPTVGRYLAATGRPSILAGTRDALFYPMMTDPGTRWGYGISIDWLGQVVEKVDGRRIDRFCQEEIFGPLAMNDTAFEVSPAMEARLASVAARGEDGIFAETALAPPPNPEVYGMGHCLYSTAPDYLRFLRMILNRGSLDGARILSEAGIARMLADNMGGLAFETMVTAAPPVTADFAPFPGIAKTHSFGFLRVEGDVPGMRSAGSQSWAGVLNTHYWIDPARDVAAVIMTQSLPFVEPRFMRVYEDYERAVYAG